MSENGAGDHSVTPQVPSLAALFVAFATASLSGFGGVLPWARRMIVERRRWMTADEFNDAYALCNFLPGPNVVNFSVVFGSRIAGRRAPWWRSPDCSDRRSRSFSYWARSTRNSATSRFVRGILGGVAPAAAGLMIATTLKMAEPILRREAGPAPLVGAGGDRRRRGDALAPAVGAARPRPAQRRAGVVVAPMRQEDHPRDFGDSIRRAVAVGGRRGECGCTGTAPSGGRSGRVDDRSAVRRDVRHRTGDARSQLSSWSR